MLSDNKEQIVVTGGAGFIGTNLIKKLVAKGHTVASLDNYSTGTRSNHIEGCEYVNADVRDIPSWVAEVGFWKPTLIYHLAALPRIQPSFDDPVETFLNNTDGSLAVAEWARKHNAKVVYSGSSSRWHNPHRSPYATFKHLGEEIFKMYRTVYGLDAEIVRFYNVYGPHEIIEGDWAAVIGKWLYQVSKGEPITIVGDGRQRRDFTHVDDIVDGLYRIGMKNQKHEDAWELGTGCDYAINQVFLMFKERFNATSVYVDDQPGNYRKTLRENNDAIERLGWYPKDRLREYILSL